MNDTKKSFIEFVKRWTDKGYEKGESKRFWIDLLQNVIGFPDATEFIIFEEQVKLYHTFFIDGCINATHVIIEHKSLRYDAGTQRILCIIISHGVTLHQNNENA